MELRVKSLARTCLVSVPPDCTASHLLQICRAAESRSVLFEGLPLQKDQSLESAGIQTGAVLLVVSTAPRLEGFPVRLLRGGKTCSIMCTETTTVADIKQRLEKQFHLLPETIKVMYQGSVLSDSSIITDCVTEQCPLFIIEKVKIPTEGTFPVLVKTLTGKNFPIAVAAGMSVVEVKELISEHEGQHMDTLRLIFAGHCLCDEETVVQLGLHEGNILHLVQRLR